MLLAKEAWKCAPIPRCSKHRVPAHTACPRMSRAYLACIPADGVERDPRASHGGGGVGPPPMRHPLVVLSNRHPPTPHPRYHPTPSVRDVLRRHGRCPLPTRASSVCASSGKLADLVWVSSASARLPPPPPFQVLSQLFRERPTDGPARKLLAVMDALQVRENATRGRPEGAVGSGRGCKRAWQAGPGMGRGRGTARARTPPACPLLAVPTCKQADTPDPSDTPLPPLAGRGRQRAGRVAGLPHPRREVATTSSDPGPGTRDAK